MTKPVSDPRTNDWGKPISEECFVNRHDDCENENCYCVCHDGEPSEDWDESNIDELTGLEEEEPKA